ncbi:glutaredoxin domain-containing protein [Pseudomonas sp. RC10]|uniref:glutaredoxin domain-containing protein n=1 Tax=Pseudomonas bambusae TaxID=3139142 RepID=UPI00313A3910
MNDVIIYTGTVCPSCHKSTQLLNSKGIRTFEINVEDDPEQMRDLMAKVGQRTVPQIFIGMHHIGDFHDMASLDRGGHLDTLLGR